MTDSRVRCWPGCFGHLATMRNLIRLLAFVAALLPAVAVAQSQVPLPANTVWGRLGIGSGSGEAIPFQTLMVQLQLRSNAVAGPSSTTPGNFALWNSATGTFLEDGGTPGTGVLAALLNPLNAAGGLVGFTNAFPHIAPTPTRAGDIIYWNGTTWVTLAGNNSGTQVFSENSSGVPGWIAASGTGTMTSFGVVAGTAAVSGTCTVTTSGTCPVVSQTAPASWTPIDSSGAGLTFTGVSANWVQIGNMVHAYGALTYPSTANGANATIGGFPVTTANNNYARGGCTVWSTASGGEVKNLLLSANLTTGVLTGTAGGAHSNADMSLAPVIFMCIYPAS